MRTDIGAALILVWALIAAVLGDMTFPRPAAAWTPLAPGHRLPVAQAGHDPLGPAPDARRTREQG